MITEVSYTLSETARRAYFIETGREASKKAEMYLHPQDMTPEQRATLHDYLDLVGDETGLVMQSHIPPTEAEMIAAMKARLSAIYDGLKQLAPHIEAAIEQLNALEPTGPKKDLDDLTGYQPKWIAGYCARAAQAAGVDHVGGKQWETLAMIYLNEYHPGLLIRALDAGLAAYERRNAYLKAEQERNEAARAAERQAKREQERQAEEVRRQAEADKLAWIAQHGSQHLQACIQAGYDCQTLYLQERVALEHPGYEVDIANRCAWSNRSCPSPEALAESLRVGGRVVWATRLVERSGTTYHAYPTQQEAVTIEGWLGRYDLFMTIGDVADDETDD